MSRWPGTADERFWAKVVKTETCWLWVGAILPTGYGYMKDNQYPHRVSFRKTKGPIPVGLEIDHLCFNRACVNPAHLEAVTPKENARRKAARITHCAKGHAYDEANTYYRKEGSRCCRACNVLNARRIRANA